MGMLTAVQHVPQPVLLIIRIALELGEFIHIIEENPVLVLDDVARGCCDFPISPISCQGGLEHTHNRNPYIRTLAVRQGTR